MRLALLSEVFFLVKKTIALFEIRRKGKKLWFGGSNRITMMRGILNSNAFLVLWGVWAKKIRHFAQL